MVQRLIEAEMVIPAPMMTEIERDKLVSDHRRSIWARGLIIIEERRVRNPAFDKKGEKTTTKIKVRPVRNQDEADYIMTKLGVK